MTTDDGQPQRAGPHEREGVRHRARISPGETRAAPRARTIPVAGVPRYRLGSARQSLAGRPDGGRRWPYPRRWPAASWPGCRRSTASTRCSARRSPTCCSAPSRRLVIGPEGSVSTLVAAAVHTLAVTGSEDAVRLASMLALLVAGCFLLARALRLGVADYLSARC